MLPKAWPLAITPCEQESQPQFEAGEGFALAENGSDSVETLGIIFANVLTHLQTAAIMFADIHEG
jgi:hypothetical protein